MTTMPLLQESQPGRGFNKMKVEPDDPMPMSSSPVNSPFPGLHHHTSSLLTPSQLLAASQTAALMAASGIPVSLHATLSSNPGLFHPSLFGHVWSTTNSSGPPQTPPTSTGNNGGLISPLSPTSKARKHNNNNIVSSSSGDLGHHKTDRTRKTPRKLQDIIDRSPIMTEITPSSGQLSPPTSGSSPPSSTGEISIIKDTSGGRGDKQFICGVCNRSFGYKHVLQNHERTHTGEKPFECPECHKRFTRDHHLKTHMRLHTGERPYHCDHCDRHFVQVANLRRHLRVHTGERPYNCKECSARFSDSNQLKAHVLIHKGEKPFRCDRCQGRFRRRHHLMHHKCGMSTTLSINSDQITNTDVSELMPSPDDIKIERRMSLDAESPEDLSHKRKSRDVRKVIRMMAAPSSVVAPIITLPLHVTLPEQTEPEDLSMSTGHNHSHSSSPSLMSRSPYSEDNRDGDEGDEDDDELDDELDEAATLFLKRQHHSRHEISHHHHLTS